MGLPEPGSEQQLISRELSEIIVQKISEDGPMPFSEYMHRCLYEPGLGYYVNGLSKLGVTGDFITAPEISADLARCLATQTAEALTVIGAGDLLEFGGGSGRLAVDLLQALDRLGCMPGRYYLLDVSPDLKQQQQQLVEERLPPALASKVEWVSAFVDDFTGVAIANELFDAFPVERFRIIDGEVRRVCVAHGENELQLVSVEDLDTTRYVSELFKSASLTLPDNFESEFCPLLKPWWSALSDAFNTGLVLTLDYGCERSRYYSPLRSGGSTRCFFRHTLHDNALIYPGVQDITADVDFSSLAEVAVSSGFELEGYTTMTQFMLSMGVIHDLEARLDQMDERGRMAATSRLKQVLLPEEMGERFMVAGFSRNIGPVLQGFSTGDQSRLL